MIKFRASSLGLIMTDAQSIDPEYLTDGLDVIARKTKKTEEEKALLQPLKDKSLSAGAKTFIAKLAKEHSYDFVEVVSGKYMDKGIIVENQAIELYNSVFFTDHKKNTVRLSNEWITGECDIIVPRIKGVDIKASWSLATFPARAEEGRDSLYEWQCRGYMMLWNVPVWEVAYCMVNTPDELIKFEQEDLHYVDHIDETKRVTLVHYQRDLALEEKIKTKCEAAKRYFLQVMEQIKTEHQY